MDHEAVWTSGAAGRPFAGPGEVVRMVCDAARAEPGGRVEVLVVSCELCGSGADGFEVAKGECFCVGCCIPVGITDGDAYPAAYPAAYPRTLAPSASPGPGSGRRRGGRPWEGSPVVRVARR
ncbi:hypothetical protein ACIPWI_33245 [Streptomyces sp. NPDC090046]|uniref:hypothetical protein n=1 Tax=Streptomyces sp. NPDC090046 TaxID=3365928 RepID=UPI00382B1274